MASAKGAVSMSLWALVCSGQVYSLDFGTRERINRQACFRMGGHDDKAASTRGIIDGGEDDGVRYPAVPRENLHKFTPSHVVSDGRVIISQSGRT